MIVIIDYGMGNLASIKNMLKHVGESNVVISNDTDIIKNAEKLILPGVGAFDHGMKALNSLCLCEPIKNHAQVLKKPILGICLGMQLLTNSSEEGKLPGLGLIDAEVLRFESGEGLKVPHMGWNYIQVNQKNNLIQEVGKQRFYFVHSYYVKCKNDKNILAKTQYGQIFHSAIYNDNVYGVQFHPEKSLSFGLSLFKNFIKL